ncbi:LOW QUALITY PROTEIN: NAD(+) hydrolase SARM1-like [Haliotis rubra]|uniref:LOW QUALITY PROTEIN: NAD(+) hydrolase SARM1-like n=1 Tax=Haliotis rubra TaxID=36100 RepID=UPI001EE6073B|nr:LOW QUALITY PROTEIN: NAD(+) hydrolase SARM1-like [Haliotis rubra]
MKCIRNIQEALRRWIAHVVIALKGCDQCGRGGVKFNTLPHIAYTMASLDEPESDQHNDDVSNDGHSIRRLHSASGFSQEEDGIFCKNDPYKALQRSQSDAALLNSPDEAQSKLSNLVSMAENFNGGTNVSECSKVYLDLSRAEAFEKVELGESQGRMVRVSSGRFLETIMQDEELQTGDLSHVYSQHSLSSESKSSLGCSTSEDDISGKISTCVEKTSTSVKVVKTSQGQSSEQANKLKANMKSSFQIYSHSLKQNIRQLQMGSVPEQINALQELNVLIAQAWSMQIYGRDLAYGLCDILRTERALDIIVNNCASSNKELRTASAYLLEQVLTTGNRKRVAESGLETIVKMTVTAKGDCELARTSTGILESLFKTSEDTCTNVIQLGGLDVILHWCRCNDRLTLRHCAIALANLALYGGPENQHQMTKRKVPEWLFPLAFINDDSVRYYACLAIAVLVANKEIEAAVEASGTLGLVSPFLASHNPAEFAQMDTSHRQGRSLGWLRRLVPVLSSKREDAQALAAFHFAMEAGIKAEQNKKEELYEIGCVEPLKRLASTPNSTASQLAAEALKIIGEEIPRKLSQQVPLWSVEDVVYWVNQVGFESYAGMFEKCSVDGDLLLQLNEDELLSSLGMNCKIARKRFLRELRDLKISADYTSCDPSKLDDWLSEVAPAFSQYTYQMLHCGVDRKMLALLTEEHLQVDCNINNGVHRMMMLQRVREYEQAGLPTMLTSPQLICRDITDGAFTSSEKTIDAFISYRRSNGSQLASLLKVHLQLRGFSVFIDIERLRAGKFDENLLYSIKMAKNFILILTSNALDRCLGDVDKKDWVHKEIVAALENKCNIIPVMDNFEWPSPDLLPDDMKHLSFFNGIRWIHDYQDACVDKLEQFLRGEVNTITKRSQLVSMGSQGSFERHSVQPSFHWSPSNESNKGEASSPGCEREASFDTGKRVTSPDSS